jgi:peptidoglycan/xylan/chitin deacetylase (PgdA/CDA1 family)
MSGRTIYSSWGERCAVELIYRAGLSWAAARAFGGRGAIYMFHSVTPDRQAHIDLDLRTTPLFLDALLANLRSAKIDVLPLDAVPARLRDRHSRRFVCFTFDDGYSDNFIHALPVFEKHDAPLCIYVSSGMLTGALKCWWLGLERLFLRNANIDIEPMHRRWNLSSLDSRTRAYREVCDWVSLDVRNNSQALETTFRRYGIDLEGIPREVGLTTEQFRRLAAHPLVTIGGHTVSHPDLSQLRDDDAQLEINQDKLFLEVLGECPVQHFAYPFGRPHMCSAREMSFVRQAGYRTATTTRHGCLTGLPDFDLFQLPRVGINRPYESISLARLQIDGVVAGFRNLNRGAA